MFTVDVRFTRDEAISLMRAIAAKQRMEPDEDTRDDLELLRLRLYERLYHGPLETIRIDVDCFAHESRRELRSPRAKNELKAA